MDPALLWRFVFVFPRFIAGLRELSHEECLPPCKALISWQLLNKMSDESGWLLVEGIFRERCNGSLLTSQPPFRLLLLYVVFRCI